MSLRSSMARRTAENSLGLARRIALLLGARYAEKIRRGAVGCADDREIRQLEGGQLDRPGAEGQKEPYQHVVFDVDVACGEAVVHGADDPLEFEVRERAFFRVSAADRVSSPVVLEAHLLEDMQGFVVKAGKLQVAP